jgi:aryl-alcohol dehydrogenase-like predicted oxidoreductase
MKSGYSEVVFGELFRASGWKRDEVVLANKLWWEFWPEQRAAVELEGSLGRMGMDYVDLAYAERPPAGLTVQEIVHDIGALIAAGKARAWGVLNWKPGLIVEAVDEASAQGVPPPCAAQLAYSLVRRSPVEDREMANALDAAGASVVASFTLDGGALTGKYTEPGATGRLAGRLDAEFHQAALKAARDLRVLADRLARKPAPMAIAFALLNPRVASVLFGATTPEQVVENVSAAEIASAMDEETIADLGKVGIG